MKNICFIILLLPFLGFGQNLEFLPSHNGSSKKSSLVHISKIDNGMRVFTKEASTCNKFSLTSSEEISFNQFHVVDYDQSGKIVDKKKFILFKNEFPSGSFTFKKGKIVYGTNEDIIGYDKLVEMYPSLSAVDQIDGENRKYPEEFYNCKLKKNFSNRIIGFKSERMVKKPEDPSKKQKKGNALGIKVSGINLNSLMNPDLYEETNPQSFDWTNSYKDAQKKSYWISEYDASCQKTGNTIAYQAYSSKEDDTKIFTQKDIVFYDVDGSITNTIDVSDGRQWRTLAKDKNTTFGGGVGTLTSVSIAEVEAYHKKRNPDANDNTIRIQNISSNGELAYSHVVDLPFPYRRLDTLIQTNNGKTIVSGLLKKGPYFVTSCDKDNCTTTLLGQEDDYYGNITDLISTKEGDFAIYLRNKYEFNVFPLSEGRVEPINIPMQSKQAISSHFDYYESDQGLIFAFKDSSLGINDFRWEMTHVQLMQYKDSKFVPISNFEEDQFVLGANKSLSDSKFIELDGNIYLLGRVFQKNDKGKLINSLSLAKFKL